MGVQRYSCDSTKEIVEGNLISKFQGVFESFGTVLHFNIITKYRHSRHGNPARYAFVLFTIAANAKVAL